MPVPNFQTFLRPILTIASDQQVHSALEFEVGAADQLQLTAEDRAQMLASGAMTVLKDRAGWAYYHMFRAGLLERPSRGHYKITARGLKALADNPIAVDQKYLKQFPEYLEYLAPKPKSGSSEAPGSIAEIGTQTPQEVIDQAFNLIRKQLASDLLEQIMKNSPEFFEELVIKLLIKMGYGGSEHDARVTGRSGDGGIDGLINEDRLGLNRIYVQAKRWQGKVGTPELRDFVGSLAGVGALKGVFITTSSFQAGVTDYLRGVQQRVVLIDGQRLAGLCIDHNLGVVTEGAYEIKKIDATFFEED